jgi:hypothetical protein
MPPQAFFDKAAKSFSTLAGPMLAVPTTQFRALLAGTNAVVAVKKNPSPYQVNWWWSDGSLKFLEWAGLKVWTTEAVTTPAAFVLAKDQAIVAYADKKAFKLSGFRRTDGATAWTVDLPDQPAMNRLAINRDGKILVSLCDGSVVCLGR